MFKIDIKDISGDSVKVVETTTLYNIDNQETDTKAWIKNGLPSRGALDVPQVTSALNISQTGTGKMLPGALGFYFNGGNNVESNGYNVSLFSTGYKQAHGFSIMKYNIMNIVMMFAARKLISANWLNGKNEYLIPDCSNDNIAEYSYDSLIFSLFNTSSNFSSLRGVQYKNEVHGIKNEFFFIPKQKMQSLADAHSNQKCFNDVRHSEDRFVSKLISVIENGDNDAKFSDEAQLVLNLARELVIDSFDYRPAFDKAKPEYQINNWDCGWYQIKGLLNWMVEAGKDKDIAAKYLEFKDAYKALGDKMRPMVYELGFLKK